MPPFSREISQIVHRNIACPEIRHAAKPSTKRFPRTIFLLVPEALHALNSDMQQELISPGYSTKFIYRTLLVYWYPQVLENEDTQQQHMFLNADLQHKKHLTLLHIPIFLPSSRDLLPRYRHTAGTHVPECRFATQQQIPRFSTLSFM